ncbi:MAG TPA: CsgG/HfaB family protein [Caulobacterales bacterium]|nr:CsgG/HfaB family protein [Caulobacterales bacterium]
MKSVLISGAIFVALAGPALAADKKADATAIPHCSKQIGTAMIVNGDQQGWQAMGLQPPAKLLRVFVQQSGCFKLVERGAGLDAAKLERELASGGELRAGSNVGKGQITTADYIIQAEVATQNSNAGGGALGGALGGVVGGRFGAVLGGVNVKKQTATAILSLINTKTTETEVVSQGDAQKSNLGFGAGGFLGGGGVVGGGYDNTEIGKVVTQAFLNAYVDMVSQTGGGNVTLASAPKKAFSVTTKATLWKYPTGSGSKVRDLASGALVYPTGNKEGVYWEVTDENDNSGWVNNTDLAPAK